MRGDYAVKINGLTELYAAFSRAAEVVEPNLQKAIGATVLTLQKHTLKQNPVPWQTGNLLQSFSPPIIGRLYGRYFPRAHYALKVHEKTSYASGEKYPYGKFMPKILDKSRKEIDEFFKTALQRIVDQLAR